MMGIGVDLKLKGQALVWFALLVDWAAARRNRRPVPHMKEMVETHAILENPFILDESPS